MFCTSFVSVPSSNSVHSESCALKSERLNGRRVVLRCCFFSVRVIKYWVSQRLTNILLRERKYYYICFMLQVGLRHGQHTWSASRIFLTLFRRLRVLFYPQIRDFAIIIMRGRLRNRKVMVRNKASLPYSGRQINHHPLSCS